MKRKLWKFYTRLLLFYCFMTAFTKGDNARYYYWSFDEGEFNGIGETPAISGEDASNEIQLSSSDIVSGKSLNFSTNYYIDLTTRRDECLLSPDLCVNGHTYCLWVKTLQNTSGWHYYFTNGGNIEDSKGVSFYHFNGDLVIKLSDGSFYYFLYHSIDFNKFWNHYCWTWNTSSPIELFINGTSATKSTSKQSKNVSTSKTFPLRFGANCEYSHPSIYNHYYASSLFDEFWFWEVQKSKEFVLNAFQLTLEFINQGMLIQSSVMLFIINNPPHKQ
ncbi:unnamed protein product [Dimorphilus gyrociliatus]|uniref:Uncharacterized protein n=1 Tax=Dimorphilus gyrociliatus TaxID=2664684 RepID=A0A7I8W680_9ANNE|nr:unnamed protein product [Dimorphilus gyrociliatus]